MGSDHTAVAGYGTKLQLGDGASPETFDDIPGLKDFSLPTGATDQIDVTAHDSPDQTKEYIAGMIETGEIGVEIFFDPNNDVHVDLYDLKDSGETRNFKVVAPDAELTEFAFAAFVTEMEINFPVEDALTANMTLKLSGAVEMTGYDS